MFFLRTRTFLRLAKIVKRGRKGKEIEGSLTFGVAHAEYNYRLYSSLRLELSRTQLRLDEDSTDRASVYVEMLLLKV